MLARLLPALLVVPLLAGCLNPPADTSGGESYADKGFDGRTWPSLAGQTVTILAYESYASSFEAQAADFENLTGAKAVLLTEADSGRVLERAIREKGDPTFDVVYGVDNVLFSKALAADVFEAYEPVLSPRVNASLAFAPGWEATPVTHGYISVNVDPRANLTVDDLDDVRDHADRFVTEDPRTSTPGLGFLLATIATYGDDAAGVEGLDGNASYDWLDYWGDLFANDATVVADWTAAYAGRFSGGYGQFEEGANTDKPIVTSYTTSPAYETYYGYDTLNRNVLSPGSTFHQIQVMGVAEGTEHPAAAQAWIEFALTDEFQAYAAGGEAVYPVVDGVSTDEVFGENDPSPGTFQDANLGYETIGANVERWLREWTDAYERARA